MAKRPEAALEAPAGVTVATCSSISHKASLPPPLIAVMVSAPPWGTILMPAMSATTIVLR